MAGSLCKGCSARPAARDASSIWTIGSNTLAYTTSDGKRSRGVAEQCARLGCSARERGMRLARMVGAEIASPEGTRGFREAPVGSCSGNAAAGKAVQSHLPTTKGQKAARLGRRIWYREHLKLGVRGGCFPHASVPPWRGLTQACAEPPSCLGDGDQAATGEPAGGVAREALAPVVLEVCCKLGAREQVREELDVRIRWLWSCRNPHVRNTLAALECILELGRCVVVLGAVSACHVDADVRNKLPEGGNLLLSKAMGEAPLQCRPEVGTVRELAGRRRYLSDGEPSVGGGGRVEMGVQHARQLQRVSVLLERAADSSWVELCGDEVCDGFGAAIATRGRKQTVQLHLVRDRLRSSPLCGVEMCDVNSRAHGRDDTVIRVRDLHIVPRALLDGAAHPLGTLIGALASVQDTVDAWAKDRDRICTGEQGRQGSEAPWEAHEHCKAVATQVLGDLRISQSAWRNLGNGSPTVEPPTAR